MPPYAMAGLRRRSPDFLDEIRRDLGQEPRRLRDLLIHIAEVAAKPRGGQIKLLLGPRHADVEQPSFFFQLAAFLHRPAVGKQAFLQPGDEHDGKLQSLGSVERHQGDRRLLVIGVLIGHQRGMIQEVPQRLAAFGALHRGRQQFPNVFDAAFGFFGSLFLKHLHVL